MSNPQRDFKARLRAQAHLCRTNPHVWVIPLLLLGGLLAGGILGVQYAIKQDRRASR